MIAYRFNATPVSRKGASTSTRSVVAKAAYNARERLRDDVDGKTYDYRKRGGVDSTGVKLAEGVPERYRDRKELWQSVEESRVNKTGLHAGKIYANARFAREYQVALPRELTREEARELTRTLAREIAETGRCVDWALHDPDGDWHQPHAHMLTTVRRWDADGERWGNQASGKDWDRTDDLNYWREHWADLENEALEEHYEKYDVPEEEREYVDYRSYLDQALAHDEERARELGITAEELPEVERAVQHLPHVDLTRQQYQVEKRERERCEREGVEYQPVTWAGQKNLEIDQANVMLDELHDQIIDIERRLDEAIAERARLARDDAEREGIEREDDETPREQDERPAATQDDERARTQDEPAPDVRDAEDGRGAADIARDDEAAPDVRSGEDVLREADITRDGEQAPDVGDDDAAWRAEILAETAGKDWLELYDLAQEAELDAQTIEHAQTMLPAWRAELEQAERKQGQAAAKVASLEATCEKLERRWFNGDKLDAARGQLEAARDKLAEATDKVVALQGRVDYASTVTDKQVDRAWSRVEAIETIRDAVGQADDEARAERDAREQAVEERAGQLVEACLAGADSSAGLSHDAADAIRGAVAAAAEELEYGAWPDETCVREPAEDAAEAVAREMTGDDSSAKPSHEETSQVAQAAVAEAIVDAAQQAVEEGREIQRPAEAAGGGLGQEQTQQTQSQGAGMAMGLAGDLMSVVAEACARGGGAATADRIAGRAKAKHYVDERDEYISR